MRAVLAAAAMAAGLAAAVPVTAQDRPAAVPSPILTVDQEQLFDRSAYGRRVRSEIEAASAALAAENRRLEAELAEEEQRLTDLRPTTDPAEFQRLAAEFDARVVEVRRTQDEKERALVRRPEEARQEFFRAAFPVLAEIVRERGALAILDTRAVLISADVIDITDEAIRRLDAALGAEGPDAPEAPEAPGTAPESGQGPGPAVSPEAPLVEETPPEPAP